MLLVAVLVALVASSSVEGAIGGSNAPERSWPWIVGVFEVINDNFIVHVCGGSLISRHHVLTAARCIKPDATYRLHLGQTDLSAPWDENRFQQRDVQRVVTHEDYRETPPPPINDVALITMSAPADITDYVQILELAQEFNITGLQVAAAGWGQTTPESASSTSRLQQVSLIALSPTQCQLISGGLVSLPNEPNHHRDFMICAESLPGQSANICFGDFGGPLVVTDPTTGRLVQVGISSEVSHRCRHPWFPAIFTKISAYRPWIERLMRS